MHEIGYIAESAPAHPGTDERALVAEPDTAKRDSLVGACVFNATHGSGARCARPVVSVLDHVDVERAVVATALHSQHRLA